MRYAAPEWRIRQVRSDRDTLVVLRVGQVQVPCVERDASVTHGAARTVPRVPDDMPPAMRQLRPHLVVSARVQLHEQDRVVPG